MKNCNHFVIGIISGRNELLRFDMLRLYCESIASRDWVGAGITPLKEVSKVMQKFKQFPYCPKCGQKLEFPEVK